MPVPSTTAERKKHFNHAYFSERYHPYYDPPRNLIITTRLAYDAEPKPKSVLELGCGRGYVVERMRRHGIEAIGMEVSDHCYLTRVTDSIIPWDITQTPWPFQDKQFEICISDCVLELLREEDLPAVMAEISRVSHDGIHSIDIDKILVPIDDCRGIDRPLEWWQSQTGQQICNSQLFNSGNYRVDFNTGVGKLNIGCGVHMFHHGWLNIDTEDLDKLARSSAMQYIRMNICDGFPIEDNTVTTLFLSHVLQDLTCQKAQDLLSECWRIMVPGGTIRVAVMDLMLLTDFYRRGDLGFFDDLNADITSATTQAAKMSAMTCVQSKYDMASITHMLREAGFTRIQKMPFNVSNNSHIRKEAFDMLPDLSIYVEASKLTF